MGFSPTTSSPTPHTLPPMALKTPLAWLQLKRERTRLLVALAGIGFADILMFMQIGFRNALFDSATVFNQSLQGEIVLISSQSVSLVAMQHFSERRLYEALAFPEVKNIIPLYLDFAIWKNILRNGKTRSIFVFGFPPSELVINLPGVQQNLDKLKISDNVLYDRDSQPYYGPVVERFEENGKVIVEANNYRIKVAGLFEMGPSFGASGNLITSDSTFLQLMKNRTRGLIDVGVIQLKPGSKTQAVIAALKAHLPEDVKVLSKQEYINFEKEYWNSSSPIGFIFALGSAVGFTVGAVIVYQILYSEVSDHLPEYATLKAIGYTDNYFLLVVFQEALILAALGYVPGFAISWLLYKLTKTATLLPMVMTISKALIVLFLTCFMCTISGAIAARKLQSADPADIF